MQAKELANDWPKRCKVIAWNMDMKLELVFINLQEATSAEPRRKFFDQQGGSIGRDSKCDLVLDCNEKIVSRVHAKIFFQGEQFSIQDLSSNGVFINTSEDPVGQNLSCTLNHGDLIRIGNYTLQALTEEELFFSSKNKIALAKKTSEKDILMPPIDSASNVSGHLPKMQVVDSSENVREINKKQIIPEKTKIGFGTPGDSFIPPVAAIPENWDTDFNLGTPSKTPSDISERGNTLRFTNHQTKLITQLLKGMGANKETSAEQITPETMELIGRSLRIAVNGLMMTRKVLQAAKNDLCLDAMPVDRQKDADPLGHIETIDSFISTLLDPRNRAQNNIVNNLAESYKDIIDDQKDINSGIQFAIENVMKRLSPNAIEEAQLRQQTIDSRGQLSIKQISNKLSQNSKTWSYYKDSWELLCKKISLEIGKQFEGKMLMAHAKRMKKKRNVS